MFIQEEEISGADSPDSSVFGSTWSKQPPAVLLMCGTLAVVAVAVCLVVAGFAVHLKTVFRTIL